MSPFPRCTTSSSFFFFNDPPTTEISTLSLHDALPISTCRHARSRPVRGRGNVRSPGAGAAPDGGAHRSHRSEEHTSELSHSSISYAVFCLKKKKNNTKKQ